MDRRDRLLRQANRIQESSNRLNHIQRIALENEKIGGDVLTTLRGQRETLERSKDEVRNILRDNSLSLR
jgi:vesicle transport through interaction with t-SNAREs protein 1